MNFVSRQMLAPFSSLQLVLRAALCLLFTIAGIFPLVSHAAEQGTLATTGAIQNTSEEWTSLAKTNLNEFVRLTNLQVPAEYQNGLSRCSQKILSNFKNNTAYFDELERQRETYVKECRQACKSSPGSSASCQTNNLTGYSRVLNFCQAKRLACLSSPNSAIQSEGLQCNCQDLCEDPRIANPMETMSKCKDGFLSMYVMFYEVGAAAVSKIQSVAAADPETNRDSAQTWWRGLYTSAVAMIPSSEDMVNKKIAELAEMKIKLNQCETVANQVPVADFIASKNAQLANSCLSMDARTQKTANGASELACSLIAPVPPVFAAFKVGKVLLSPATLKFFQATSASGKALLAEVLRAGVPLSEKAARILGDLGSEGARALAALKKLSPDLMKIALREIESKCNAPAVASSLDLRIELFLPHASASSGTCALQVLEHQTSVAQAAETSVSDTLRLARDQAQKHRDELMSNANSNPVERLRAQAEFDRTDREFRAHEFDRMADEGAPLLAQLLERKPVREPAAADAAPAAAEPPRPARSPQETHLNDVLATADKDRQKSGTPLEQMISRPTVGSDVGFYTSVGKNTEYRTGKLLGVETDDAGREWLLIQQPGQTRFNATRIDVSRLARYEEDKLDPAKGRDALRRMISPEGQAEARELRDRNAAIKQTIDDQAAGRLDSKLVAAEKELADYKLAHGAGAVFEKDGLELLQRVHTLRYPYEPYTAYEKEKFLALRTIDPTTTKLSAAEQKLLDEIKSMPPKQNYSRDDSALRELYDRTVKLAEENRAKRISTIDSTIRRTRADASTGTQAFASYPAQIKTDARNFAAVVATSEAQLEGRQLAIINDFITKLQRNPDVWAQAMNDPATRATIDRAQMLLEYNRLR